MSRPLILIDKDDTLVDVRTEQVTDDRIHGVIARMQDAGFRIGINSNSPMESLHVFADRLGIRGPIIGELGAIVHPRTGAESLHLVSEQMRQAFADFPQVVRRLLAEHVTEVWVGDVVRERFVPRVHVANGSVVGVSTLRASSGILFCWRVDSRGVLIPDLDLLTQVQTLLSKGWVPYGALEPRVNHEHAVLIIHPLGMAKQKGVERLRVLPDFRESDVYMIGNAQADYCGSTVIHGAVGNASEAFKRSANAVSHLPFTSGVIDLLERIETLSTL